MTRPTAPMLVITVSITYLAIIGCASYAIGIYVSHLAQWLFIIPVIAGGAAIGWWAGGIMYPRRRK